MNFLSISWWRNISQKMGRSVGWGCLVVFAVPLVIGFSCNQLKRGIGERADSTDEAGVILNVNGEPITQKDFQQAAARLESAQPGMMYALEQGGVVDQLIQQRLLMQMAKALKLRPADADVDRMVAQTRESVVGAKGTDSDWDAFLDQRHITPEEFRQQVENSLMGKVVMDYYKQQEKVTPDEVKNRSGEARLNLVIIHTQSPPNPNIPFPPDPKALPDAAAKQKAEDLLAQVKAGADIAKIAKANSMDGTSTKGGDTEWMPEYKDSPLTIYGKEFADAVHQTPKGQFTPVIKVSGFQPGYAFARVTDRRNNVPKDFDEKKATEDLQTQRAQEKLVNDLKAKQKEAKIQFAKGAEDKKAFYDYYKYQMVAMGQAEPSTPEEKAVTEATVNTEIDGVYQRHASDGSHEGTTAALILAEDLKKKLKTANPADQPALRDRLIKLYETALKSTEDPQMRFELADLYQEKKDHDSSENQLKKIASQLASNPPFDLDSMQQAMRTHVQLQNAFHKLGSNPTAPRPSAVEAEQKEKAAIESLRPRLNKEEQKAAEEARKQKATQPGSIPGLPPGMGVPGGSTPATGGTAPTTGGTSPAPGPGATPNPGADASGGASKPGATPAAPAPGGATTGPGNSGKAP